MEHQGELLKVPREASHKRRGTSSIFNLLFRITTVLLCIASLTTMVYARQRLFRIKVQWKDVHAFLGLVILLAICLAYSTLQAFSALFRLCSKPATSRNFCAWMTFIADQTLTYALLGIAAASAEVAYIALKGAPTSGWNKVCTNLDTFCWRGGVSIILALLAVISMVASSAISGWIKELQSKTKFALSPAQMND